MTLGKQISRLRAARDCPRGPGKRFAGIRQSISKWETDTSVPELDKR